MPEQSLYKRYSDAVRRHPEAYVVIRADDHVIAFDHLSTPNRCGD